MRKVGIRVSAETLGNVGRNRNGRSSNLIGDTVKVVVHADQTKPDYDPRDAVLEFEVA